MGLFRNAGRRWQIWMHDIGNFQSRVLLTVFYFTALVPFALLTRALADPFDRRRRDKASTWHPWAERKTSLDAARRQY